jgi:hypothetical protein
MDNSLKGLFGGGEEGAAKTDRARDFVKRFSEGKPDEGYTHEEAASHLNSLLKHADADQVRRATKSAITNMPEDQQKEFGAFVSDLKARKSGGGNASGPGGNLSVDDISDMFGQAGGSANSLDDLLGGLLGGGTSGGSTSGGGGIGGMLSGMLGGLMGGGDKSRSHASDSGMPDLGGLLGSSAGKMVMGGIAAYLTKELLDGKG